MDITSFRKVLVLAPHTDDGELGAGGTIAKLIEAGTSVYYAAFSTAEQSVPDGFPKDILKSEVRKATFRLGIPPDNLLIYNYEVRKLGLRPAGDTGRTDTAEEFRLHPILF